MRFIFRSSIAYSAYFGLHIARTSAKHLTESYKQMQIEGAFLTTT